jgi:hypothetical protein
MTLLDPKARTARGIQQQTTLLAKPAPEPATLFESSWRDFIFVEVWTRPGLDLREETSTIALLTANPASLRTFAAASTLSCGAGRPATRACLH